MACRLTPDDLSRLQADWAREHLLRLPGLIDPDLLASVRARVRRSEFFVLHQPTGDELCMTPNEAVWMLDFLVNAPEVLRTIETITGCGPIGSFFGRIYQLAPGTDRGHDWHDDAREHRMLGASVNLTEGRYEGGLLQMRDANSLAPLSEIANTGEGDGVIFRLGDDIEHRVLPVTGNVARLAYAGWFHREPVYGDLLRADPPYGEADL